jgi:hypothetical protein
MTNYEKYKEQIEKITRLGFTFALNKDTEEIVACPDFSCSNCTFNSTYLNGCAKEKFKWVDEEYIEQETDWSKVPVDTPILVRNLITYDWIERHFAKYENNFVYAWCDGKTSYTTDSMNYWNYAKLTEADNGI